MIDTEKLAEAINRLAMAMDLLANKLPSQANGRSNPYQDLGNAVPQNIPNPNWFLGYWDPRLWGQGPNTISNT